MKNRKRWMAAAGAAILTISICMSGCGGSTGESGDGETQDEKVSVKILQFKTELSDQMNEMAQAYMDEHPEVNLEVESIISDSYDSVLKTRFASDEAPDIFNNEGHANMNLWMEHLEDLSDQAWTADIVESAREGITSDGAVYGLPLYLEGYGFLYNKDYFEEAGISEVPLTLTELEQAVKKLEDAGIPAFSVNGAEWYPNGLFLANIPLAQQEDSNAFISGINDGSRNFADDEKYQEWTGLVRLMRDHAVSDPLSTDFSTVVSDFASGKAAMIMGLNGYEPTIDEINPEMNMGIMPMPINEDAEQNDKLYVSASTYWCINKNSSDASKAASKEFLEWLVTSETGKRYVTEVFGFIPGLNSIDADEEAVGVIGTGLMEYISDEKTIPWEWMKYPDGVTTEFGGTIQKFYAGEVDENGMLEDFSKGWDKLKDE